MPESKKKEFKELTSEEVVKIINSIEGFSCIGFKEFLGEKIFYLRDDKKNDSKIAHTH